MKQMEVYNNKYSYCGPISMLKKLHNGDLIVVFREALWRGFSTHGDPTTRTSLIRSTDEGTTWHSLVTPDPSGGNGATVNQLADGTLIVSNFHWIFVPLEQKRELSCLPSYSEQPDRKLALALDGVYTCRSHTQGYTWEAPRKLEQHGFWALTTAGPIAELPDGSLLMPVNAQQSADRPFQCAVMQSVDRGVNWDYLGSVTGEVEGIDFHESRLALLPDGRLLAAHRTQANFYQSTSDDAGHTWQAPTEMPIWCGGSSPADLQVLRDGRILCTYGHRRPPYGVRACLSADGGKTWNMAEEKILRDDGLGRDMGYPSSQQLHDGSILTVYYWHAEDQIRYMEATRWQLD